MREDGVGLEVGVLDIARLACITGGDTQGFVQ